MVTTLRAVYRMCANEVKRCAAMSARLMCVESKARPVTSRQADTFRPADSTATALLLRRAFELSGDILTAKAFADPKVSLDEYLREIVNSVKFFESQSNSELAVRT
ncbi:hypothetical protein EVAR_20406_1 [Eumeta japonica]|uniref:Uncharacterized protein n=1 Tax=Eumeta variegata TaxID=151549 RepID=A0A4C1TXV0_EUMVA|nr:hypothetical protein EVAR_20406_1 [Eumeta japonica]